MSSPPFVTTIIPSFNHAHYVADAIESVLAQDYPAHELIVVDDGSKDASADVIRRYADHPLVTVILNERNRGQSAVLKQGLAAAKGEFICLLPSDDWLMPERNRLQVDLFQRSGPDVGIIYGRGRIFHESDGSYEDPGLPLLRGNLFEHLLLESEIIFPVTPMIRRECYEQFPPDSRMSAEGEALWTKMAMRWKVDFVNEVVGVMRHHERNSGRNWALTYRENVAYWARFFDDPALPAEVRGLRARKLAKLHRTYGLTFLRDAGDAAMAREALLAAARARPAALLADWRLSAGLGMALLGLAKQNDDPRKRAAVDAV